MSHQAYPLHWPAGQARTPSHKQQEARFDTNFARARDGLAKELERMKAKYPVLSTNIELRLDGQPYANRPEPQDAGVAVYFEWKGRQMCFACDKWTKVRDNIQAVRKTIDALRGIERWGSGDMMERAFEGFTALPDPAAADDWRTVLGVPGCASLELANQAYLRLRSLHHPDKGGQADMFYKINNAIAAAEQEFGR